MGLVLAGRRVLMKLVVIPRSKEELKNLSNIADSFVVGYQGLCVNVETSFSQEELEELIDICTKNHKELFVLLNKNMMEEDLSPLKEALLFLDTKKVAGVFYYDIAIVEMKEELSLHLPLVWAQEHMTTNALTSNFWYQHGAAYTLLSSEITKEEILAIKKETKAKLIVPIFGYPSMFVSKRHLITNYCEMFHIKNISGLHYIKDATNIYPIQNDEDGTVAYASHAINGIEEMPCFEAAGINYVLLNSIFIEEPVFYEIVECYAKATKDNVSYCKEQINTKLACDEGFLYKETIYKVKP